MTSNSFDLEDFPSLVAISYNRPRFHRSASWSSTAITVATNATIGFLPAGFFIDINDTIYTTDREHDQTVIWTDLNTNLKQSAFVSSGSPQAIFVTSAGDIYVDNGQLNKRVDRRAISPVALTPAMNVRGSCFDLFVAIDNTLYCSLGLFHQVVAKSLSDSSNVTMIVAGTNCNDSTANALNGPHGIFVDINLDLYVADRYNHRIQSFHPNRLYASTVAGGTASIYTIILNEPTDVVLAADSRLFIVDSGNHRIVASGPDGFRCLVGCWTQGPSSALLKFPRTLSFDSGGNMFVVDSGNQRIQKFILINETVRE